MILNPDNELVNLSFQHPPRYTANAIYCKDLAPFQPVISWLTAYFEGKAPSATDLRINPQGITDFRWLTWQALLKVPYGQVTTYKELAIEVAKQQGRSKQSPQAIGNALSQNPLPLIIPCHRVITSDNRLGGYHGGVKRKEWLLSHEGVDIDRLR